ncbi:glycosyltransferase family 2 protein [Wenyingzhuangia sp. IMCC45574]
MIPFSIVTPVYNKETFLHRTIESVLHQKHSNFELLLLNDGSTDNSQAIIDSFRDPRIKTFTGKNIGAAAARNFLIEQAQYNYIAFLDADDLWMPNHLTEMSRLIDKYPDEKVFATNTIKTINQTIIPRNYSIEISNKADLVTNFFEASYIDCIILTPSSVIHKDVFDTCGNFDRNIKSGQDTDLYIRIGLHYPIVFSPLITVNVIGNFQSLSNTTNYLEKMSFEKLMTKEKENLSAKKYYDINRYALAIQAKEQGYGDSFNKLIQLINPENLTWKQKILLKLPSFILRLLQILKQQFFSLGFNFTVFK